jgi:hypothetical protein
MDRSTSRAFGIRRLAGLAVLALLLGGCGDSGGGLTPRPNAAPEEDVWAIRCVTLGGPNRFQLADNYAGALKRVEGIKPNLVQVFHESAESAVYYGRYRQVYDPRSDTESFRPDNLRDLNLIRQLSMNVSDPVLGSRVVWPFQLATMDTLPGGRGTHPEWELSNARGYYSLQVAVFYNTEGMRRRRFAAEEYCRLLREERGAEAYYHHGRVNSSVCIGAFPEQAIKTFQKNDPLTGILRVTSKIVDERMLELQREYPHNLHNGRVFYEILRDPRTGQTVRDAHTSFAVEIPRAQTSAEPFVE